MKVGLLGILVVIVSVFFLKRKIEVYHVESGGRVVSMRIKTLPSSCRLTRGHYYMDLEYARRVFKKRIPAGFCELHKPGELIQMRYLEGYEFVLFPDEKVRGDFIAIGFFVCSGFLLLLVGIFQKKV